MLNEAYADWMIMQGGGGLADLLRCFPAGRREVLWQIYCLCDDVNENGSCYDDMILCSAIIDLGLGKSSTELSKFSTESLIHRKARFFAI